MKLKLSSGVMRSVGQVSSIYLVGMQVVFSSYWQYHAFVHCTRRVRGDGLFR